MLGRYKTIYGESLKFLIMEEVSRWCKWYQKSVWPMKLSTFFNSWYCLLLQSQSLGIISQNLQIATSWIPNSRWNFTGVGILLYLAKHNWPNISNAFSPLARNYNSPAHGKPYVNACVHQSDTNKVVSTQPTVTGMIRIKTTSSKLTIDWTQTLQLIWRVEWSLWVPSCT